MSLHYEWVLSLHLRADVPAGFVSELRWLMGLQQDRPETRTLEIDHPALACRQDVALPEGELAQLTVQRPLSNGPDQLGLYSRTFQLDDDMYELIQVIPPWLAAHSATRGWIGAAREEMGMTTWMDYYAQDGCAYGSAADGSIEALSAGAPPFTLWQAST